MVYQVHFCYDVIIHSDKEIDLLLFFFSLSSPSPPLLVSSFKLPLYIVSALCTFLHTLQTVSFCYRGTWLNRLEGLEVTLAEVASKCE